MISFDEVGKKFGDIAALSGISFDIKDGELVFITGRSGAGKTTLINLLLRRYLPTEGKIKVDGLDLSLAKKKDILFWRQKVGVVFQDYKLLKDRTVFENVAVVLRIKGEREDVIKKKVEEILTQVGLISRSFLFPRQLAGGEAQRVGLARALVIEPKVVVADEPTGNLDEITSQHIFDLLGKINQEGRIVIVATHNRSLVEKMKGRVIELEEGRLIVDH